MFFFNRRHRKLRLNETVKLFKVNCRIWPLTALSNAHFKRT